MPDLLLLHKDSFAQLSNPYFVATHSKSGSWSDEKIEAEEVIKKQNKRKVRRWLGRKVVEINSIASRTYHETTCSMNR